MDHAQHYKEGEKVTVACIWGNVLLVLAKGAAGIIGGSKAMVADAIHSASDVLATLVVLFSIKIAKRPSDDSHHYGHGKIEPIAAMVVGLFLAVAGIYILEGAAVTIRNNSYTAPQAIALYAAIVSIAVKEAMFRWAYSVGKKLNSDSIIANAWDHRSDAYSSVGTLVGIGGSMLGRRLGIHWLQILDPVAGGVVALFILKISWDIMRDSVKGLMDGAPDPEIMQKAETLAMNVEGVERVPWVKGRFMGPFLLIDMTIEVNANETVQRGHDIASQVKKCIQNSIPNVGEVLIHINPCPDRGNMSA